MTQGWYFLPWRQLCYYPVSFARLLSACSEVDLPCLNQNSLLSFAVLIISVASDQKLLDVFCCTEGLLHSS